MTASQANDWLLIEQFGQMPEPTVIAKGQTPKRFLPLERVVRSRTHRMVILTALESMAANATPSRIDFEQAGTRYLLIPLTDFSGYTAAVLVHYGEVDSVPPSPPECAAWHFNATQGTASGSSELLDLYDVAAEQRQTERPLYEAFHRLVSQDHEAMAKLMAKRPGVTHQAFETVETDAGERWIAHYSCRFVQVDDGDVILHGVTRRMGGWEPGTPAPDPQTLTSQLSSVSPVGFYRLIVDPETGVILQAPDGLPEQAPPGTATLQEILGSTETAEHALDHLRASVSGQIPITGVVTTAATGREIEVAISPIQVGTETSAALVQFWYPADEGTDR